MRYQILTIFPELFENFTKSGLVSRAIEQKLIQVETIHLRNFAINTHGQIDDTPYGGGSGMVLRPEPAVAAIEQAKVNDPKAKVVLFTPRGQVFTRSLARQLIDDATKTKGGLILLCCRYEGADERIAQNFVDYEISVGDFILMGGEIPAMALIEATSRFVPEVLGNPESALEESFESGLLEYPQYTKPQVFRGSEVPEVLLSGHHQEIAKWRYQRSCEDTKKRRPDLFAKIEVEEEKHSRPEEKAILADTTPSCELDIALIHYPVLNKEGKIITSSITALDLPDIARSAKTFGVDRYYVVHPTKAMRRLMEKICEHWAVGYGLQYNPNRSEALEIISVVPDFDDVLNEIEERTGKMPKIMVTSARKGPSTTSYSEMRQVLAQAEEPHLLLFGTGWGLADELMERADYRLEPICGPTDYNHLSVRAAAAIIFDRLFATVPDV